MKKSNTSTTSATFIAYLKSGKDDSWLIFYDIYSSLILKFAAQRGCTKEQAEDVLQEVVLALAKLMPEFNYDRDKGKFRSFLFKLTESKIVDTFRRERKLVFLDNTELFSKNQDGENSGENKEARNIWDDMWEKDLVDEALSKAKSQVADNTFTCFKKVFLENLPVKDVAKQLGISPNLVSRHKYKVLRKIIDIGKSIRKMRKEY